MLKKIRIRFRQNLANPGLIQRLQRLNRLFAGIVQ